jgi:hypothetical protein
MKEDKLSKEEREKQERSKETTVTFSFPCFLLKATRKMRGEIADEGVCLCVYLLPYVCQLAL